MESRVKRLEEEGSSLGPTSEGFQEELLGLMERVGDLEVEGPRGAAGRGVGLVSAEALSPCFGLLHVFV